MVEETKSKDDCTKTIQNYKSQEMILTIAAITLYLLYGYVLATLRYNAKGRRSLWMVPFWLPFVAWMIVVAIFYPTKEF